MSNLLNGNDMPFFFGIVEDRLDPERKGRVRVRCFAIHSEDKTQIPTEALPWAKVLIPGCTPRNSSTNIWEGTLVFGVFVDGVSRQRPMVLGIVPSNIGGGDPINGFTDPRESAPVGRPGSDPAPYNRQPQSPGMNEYSDQTRHSSSVSANIKKPLAGIPAPGGATWTELQDPYAAQYPYNNAMETESGHAIELDDSPGAERIHVFHRSGSFIELHPDGSIVYKAVGSDNKIVLRDSLVAVQGNSNESTVGNKSEYVGGNISIEVIGNANIKVNGNVTEDVSGNVTRTVGGNVTESISGNFTQNVGGSTTMTASTINLN